ncbi:Katanin p60 ATPase-containing subunit A1 [Tritrichomonas musculus]|uniref:Katanin p60 ATPase-containing subunit A1 n=1 Tax=Tritrichomonas musculus TaxID=1915356 RepID=A0ABR2L897_9EUKA
MSVLNEIFNARQSAINENYEDALASYQNARKGLEYEIANCHDAQQNKNWNSMIHDIDEEIKIIQQITTSTNAFFTKINSEPPKNDNIEKEPPIQIVKAGQRPVVNNIGFKRDKVPERPFPNRQANPQNRNPGYGRQPPPKKDPNSKDPNKNKNKSPTELDPSTNPLVQQIIDMGILVREPNVSWDSIAGLADIKKLLRKQLVILPLRPDIAKGLLAPWKSVLLYGPPGTGKTFLAKAVATECKRTFFNITSATITSRFLGESEKLISFLFQYAEQMAPSTIFFDEIDSIASQRGTSNEGESSRRMKAQLLTNIEGIGSSDSNNVFVLAATNFPWDIDEALLRRFQKRVYIPLPDQEGRKAILEMGIREYTDDTFDYDGWAKKLEGYSCADITNLCRDAAQMVLDRKMDCLSTQQFVNIESDDAKIIITNDDFQISMSKRKSSVDPASLAKYEEWRKAKSAE